MGVSGGNIVNVETKKQNKQMDIYSGINSGEKRVSLGNYDADTNTVSIGIEAERGGNLEWTTSMAEAIAKEFPSAVVSYGAYAMSLQLPAADLDRFTDWIKNHVPAPVRQKKPVRSAA